MHLAGTKVVSPHGQGQFVHRPQLDGSGSHVLTQYTTTKTGICKNAKLMPKPYETSKTGLVFSSVVLLPKPHRHFRWVWLPNTIWCLWPLNCNMRVLLPSASLNVSSSISDNNSTKSAIRARTKARTRTTKNHGTSGNHPAHKKQQSNKQFNQRCNSTSGRQCKARENRQQFK